MKQFPKNSEIEALSSWILDESKNLGVSDADVLYVQGQSTQLSLMDGEVEESISGTSVGIGIRTIMSDGRQGISYGNSLDRLSVKELLEWSVANCRNSEPEEGISLYSGKLFNDPSLFLEDPEIYEITSEDRMNRCLEMNNHAKSLDKRIVSVRSSGWQDGYGSSFYCTTSGLAGWESATRASCGVALLVSDGTSTEMGAYGESSRKLDELDINFSAAESVRKTISYLGATTVKTGRYSAVLDQESAASLVDIVADLFCAPEVHKGRSMMKGQLGNKVASSCVTLIDNGRIAWKSGSSSWDSEGVPTGETLLIKDGIASSYLYNLQYAWKDGVKSTGNGSRGLSSLPDVDTSNIILKPGTESRENIISSIKKGIYITEFMGLHTVDSISGNFSIGAKGLMIENGELTHAVSGVTIASNLLDFIKSITVVGSDLKYFGSVAAPTVVVEDIVIAGD